jgi:hypothetical protein
VLKTFVCLSIFAIAVAAEPVFAQTSNIPAPSLVNPSQSPLNSGPAAGPSGNTSNPATPQTKKKHSHRSQPGTSTSGN